MIKREVTLLLKGAKKFSIFYLTELRRAGKSNTPLNPLSRGETLEVNCVHFGAFKSPLLRGGLGVC